MKYITAKINQTVIVLDGATTTDFFNIDKEISKNFPEKEIELTISTKKPVFIEVLIKNTQNVKDFIDTISSILSEENEKEEMNKKLLEEVKKIAEEKEFSPRVFANNPNTIEITSFTNDYFNYHSFSVYIEDGKFVIQHCSDNYGYQDYSVDENGEVFTKESIIDTIERTVNAMFKATEILNESPISNF